MDPWAEPRHRIRAQLTRALGWSEELLVNRDLTQRELAAREGLPQPRVSEALALLRLAKPILLELADPACIGPVPTLDDLAKLARTEESTATQVGRFRSMCRAVGRPGTTTAVPRSSGFQHLLARARRYHEALTAKRHRSVAQLARAEGVHPRRVGQLLDLLALAPEVLAEIDVPADVAPHGLRQADLRSVVRLEHDAQRRWFAERWPQRMQPSAK